LSKGFSKSKLESNSTTSESSIASFALKYLTTYVFKELAKPKAISSNSSKQLFIIVIIHNSYSVSHSQYFGLKSCNYSDNCSI